MNLSDIQKKEALDLLKTLVKIPSPYFQEEEIMNYVENLCGSMNLPIERQDYSFSPLDFSGINLHGKLEGGSGPTLYLGGHLDTVQLASGWTKPPFKATLEGNRLYGTGVLDMKAGCAAILLALKYFRGTYPDFKGKVLYHFASVEEGPYGLGTTFYLKDVLKEEVDFAIITEPSSAISETTEPALCLGAKGGYNYQIHLQGISTHAATPELGISAAEEGAKLIPLLNHVPTKKHPLLGEGASCVIAFHSGSGACSVPDQATIEVFRHVVPGEDMKSIEKEVKEILEGAELKCSWKIQFRESPAEGFDGGFPPYVTDEHHPYVELLQQLYARKDKQKPLLLASKAIGDFNLIGGVKNIPTVLFGPQGNGIHQPDEYVLLDSYYKTIEILYEFLEELLV